MSQQPVDREQHETLAYDPVAKLLAGMRTDCDALAGELDEAFRRLESWRANLEREAQQLQANQAGLEREHEQLRQARQACELADGDASAELTALREQLTNVERESNEARASLEAELAAVRSEQETARSELEAARAEAQECHEQMQAAEQREAALVADHAAELLELRGQLAASEQSAELHAEQDDLAEQNSALEQELEAVRERAGALGEQLEQAEREATAREAEWSQEIETLREAVAHQQELAEAAASQVGSPRSPQEEAVLGAVVAQFERLRGERTRRSAKDEKKAKRKKK